MRKGPAEEEEAFLSRWSRRKQAGPVEPVIGDASADVPSGPVPAERPPADRDPLDETRTDEELLAELDLPDPDAMKDDGDFSAFMQARVPERLRRRALRTLWRSNPVLANLDELIDYGEDYTDAATVMENMQTVYEVGKGAAEKWKRHVAALAAAEEENGEDEGPHVPEHVEEEPETATAEALAPPPLPDPVEALAPTVDVAEIPVPRHMRFRFD